MRYFLALVVAVGIAGCVRPPAEWSGETVEVGRQRLPSGTVISSRIDANRTEVTYELRNPGKWDSFCGSVSFRVIFDDPNSYLELGEQVFVLESVFLRMEESVKGDLMVTAPVEARSWHVRAVEAYRGTETCRAANFIDYCEFAKHATTESAMLKGLFEQSGAETCELLYEWYASADFVDLRSFSSFSIRPLVYLEGRTKIVVKDSDEALGFVRRLSEERYSMWAPVVLVESAQCERPVGTESKLPPKDCLVSNVE